MRILSLIILMAFLSACATPGGEYCDPARPGFIRGLRCSGSGYDNYVGNMGRTLERERSTHTVLQAERHQLSKKKEEREKELATLKKQLSGLDREVETLIADIESLREGQTLSKRQAEQIRTRLLRVSTLLVDLSHTYDALGNNPQKYKITYQQERQFKTAASNSRDLAKKFRTFAIDVVVSTLIGIIPMGRMAKSLVGVGWIFYNNFIMT